MVASTSIDALSWSTRSTTEIGRPPVWHLP